MTNIKSITFVSPFCLPLLSVPPRGGAGGAERQFYLYGKALGDAGWDVNYIVNDNKNLNAKPTIMPVYKANFGYLGGAKIFIFWQWLTLLFAMYRSNSKYYVVKTPAHLLAVMSIFTKLFRRRLVFWAQSDSDSNPDIRPFGGLHGAMHDMGIKCADIVIAQNVTQVKGFLDTYLKSSSIVPNISGWLGQIAESSVEGATFDLLWVGNSHPNKRYELVIELARLLPDRTFGIAMGAVNKERFNQALVECSKLHNVRFLGEMPPLEMEIMYSKCKIVLNTSRREGFPNTFLQAWQCSVPVISVCINPNNVITDNKLGFVLFNSDDQHVDNKELAPELAKQVEIILNDLKLYKELADNCYAYVQAHHGADVCVTRLLSILST